MPQSEIIFKAALNAGYKEDGVAFMDYYIEKNTKILKNKLRALKNIALNPNFDSCKYIDNKFSEVLLGSNFSTGKN
ncbi:hypothetical protein JCM19240_1551 [Vibrio maritimus]|uniref:Uncharacterized protein n=1 Tax=Vibrio maritimus TaxID=990268 RepID=A0A090TBK1_9VIBR|nr:hypothetical protein JCM19240_1551 [Vibrio maritimus]